MGATRLLLNTQAEDRLVSVLSRMEIEGGMRSGERAGEHLRTYRRSHQGIDVVDFVIAATAEAHAAQLATLNPKHFPMFRGLARPW